MSSNDKPEMGGQFYNQTNQQQYLTKIERGAASSHNQQNNSNNMGNGAMPITSPRHAIGGISGVVNN